MAKSLTVLELTPLKYDVGLVPVPNVSEIEFISKRTRGTATITDLMKDPIPILADYRGHLLYCRGGVCVHRRDPKTEGCNGWVSLPRPGLVETVVISSSVGKFEAQVRFD